MLPRILLALLPATLSIQGEPANHRKPSTDAELRYWLENMIVHHGFSTKEVTQATGMKRWKNSRHSSAENCESVVCMLYSQQVWWLLCLDPP